MHVLECGAPISVNASNMIMSAGMFKIMDMEAWTSPAVVGKGLKMTQQDRATVLVLVLLLQLCGHTHPPRGFEVLGPLYRVNLLALQVFSSFFPFLLCVCFFFLSVRLERLKLSSAVNIKTNSPPKKTPLSAPNPQGREVGTLPCF